MKDTNYKIEKNVPISSARSRWADVAKEMEVGDSVLVHGRLEAMNLRNAIVRSGFKAVTRGNDQPETRVWKVSK